MRLRAEHANRDGESTDVSAEWVWYHAGGIAFTESSGSWVSPPGSARPWTFSYNDVSARVIS
jgi:hypothetical protein